MAKALSYESPSKLILRQVFWSAAATVGLLLSLSAWAFSSPVGSSPDDDYHNVSIWCGQGYRDGLCEKGPNGGSLVNESLRANFQCFASQPDKNGSCDPAQEFLETGRVNGGENPRVFYWVMSWFAGPEISNSILTVRIANALMISLIFFAALFFTPTHLRRIPVLGLLATIVPLGMFIMPSTNPSSWGYAALLILFSSILGFLIAKDWRARIPLGLISGISLLMAAGSRPESALYAVIAIAIAWFLVVSFKQSNLPKLLFGIGIVLIASFFFLTSGNSGAVITGAPGGGLTLPSIRGTFYNLLRLPDLYVGAFGMWGLGWLDTPMLSSVWAFTYGLYFALIFAAIKYFSLKQSVAVVAVFLTLVAVPMVALHASGLVVGQFVQPRYLLPLMGLLVATALFRTSMSDGLQLSRGQMWVAGFGLFAANSISLHTNLRRYLTGLDGNQINLNRDIEWWWVDASSNGLGLWFSPNFVWIFGTFAFALFLISLWKLRHELGLLGPVRGAQLSPIGFSSS